MQDMLNIYKDKFIKRMTAIYEENLNSNNGFDLQYIDEINNEKLINWLITKKDKEINIIEEPHVMSASELEKIRTQLMLAQNIEIENFKKLKMLKAEELKQEQNIDLEELKKIRRRETEELNKKIEGIEIKYRLRLKEQEDQIEIARKKQLANRNIVSTLSMAINKIKKESGKEELYIGYPFLEGMTNDGKFVRAPLYLFPVSISTRGANISLIHDLESKILLNKLFLETYIIKNETKLANIDVKYDSLDNNFIDDIVDKLNKNNISISYNGSSVEKFESNIDKIKSDYSIGSIVIKRYTILGHFKISNPIYADYEELRGKEKGKLLEELLDNKVNYNSNKYKEIEEHGKLSFSEKDLYMMSNLDYNQEKAVKVASEANNLVIYGPSRTGKSQTVVNIISDLLAKNKKVLIVSKNKHSLENIYNMLGVLNDKAIIVNDENKGEKSFYERIKNALESTSRTYVYVDNDIISQSKNIDKYIYTLETLAKVLNEKRDYGMSLQQMYENTYYIESKNDNRYKEFLRFREKNTLKSYKYNDLKHSVSRINDLKIKSFINYRMIKYKNMFVEDINYKVKIVDIEELLIQISTIIDSIESIKTKRLENEEMYNNIVSLLELKQGIVDEESIIVRAKEVNSERNSYLLEELNNGEWWSIKYLMSYSQNKKQENINRKIFEEREVELINKAIEIYNEIKLIPDKIRIIKKVINEKVYNRVNKDLNNLENIIIDLKSIKDGLELIQKHRDDLGVVGKLTRLEEHILNVCYDKDIDIYIENISRLVEFVTLDHIYEIEEESEVKESLEIVNEFYDIVDKVKDGIDKKKELIIKYIINKWNMNTHKAKSNKKYREFKYHTLQNNNLLPIKKYIEDYKDILFDIFPCFLLNIETVSQVIPLQKELFDVVIFDDASELYIEDVIPSIFRAKNVIIAGDDRYGDSLLNVAKTKYESIYLNIEYVSPIEIVTSIEPEDLSTESYNYRGIKLFNSLNKFNNTSVDRANYRDFKAEVYEELVRKGYEVHTQVGVLEYMIDLAIYDKETSRYILGIEFDGSIYNTSKSARERDVHRHIYLESRGWKIIRIWSQNWWKDPQGEIEKIENLII